MKDDGIMSMAHFSMLSSNLSKIQRLSHNYKLHSIAVEDDCVHVPDVFVCFSG